MAVKANVAATVCLICHGRKFQSEFFVGRGWFLLNILFDVDVPSDLCWSGGYSCNLFPVIQQSFLLFAALASIATWFRILSFVRCGGVIQGSSKFILC
jgi:hypothetical protein